MRFLHLARVGAGILVLTGLAACAANPRPVVTAMSYAVPVETTDPEWPRPNVLNLAMQAYRCGAREGQFTRPVLTIIDYTLPANVPRLWVINVETSELLHHEVVAHGDGSGENYAVSFSNMIDSHQSSLGLFRTDETYVGQFGYALRLSGLEPGVNDNARERAIVMHGTPGVTRDAVVRGEIISQSWGCPAVPEDVSTRIIDSIAGGTAIFAYYPEANWLQESRYLRCDSPVAHAKTDQ